MNASTINDTAAVTADLNTAVEQPSTVKVVVGKLRAKRNWKRIAMFGGAGVAAVAAVGAGVFILLKVKPEAAEAIADVATSVAAA